MSDVTKMLHAGIVAAQAGANAEAHRYFVQVIEQDRRNELAWLWLSSVLPTAAQALKCLDHLLTINPGQPQVREAREILQVRMLLEEANLVKHASDVPAEPSNPQTIMRLGELLVERGMLTQDELGKALAAQERQARNGKQVRLGEVLVNTKLIRREQLETALRTQIEVVQQQVQHSPVVSLGQFLVERTYITPDQLAQALSIQSTSKQRGRMPKLGDILVKLGYLTPTQLERALKTQIEQYNSRFY
ncbi:MAG: hypothetical protein H0X37_19660 [Herpetosiphonaceae bacterium]|nr:hypothetical protein [Herpetosiphonaceae bacterium]